MADHHCTEGLVSHTSELSGPTVVYRWFLSPPKPMSERGPHGRVLIDSRTFVRCVNLHKGIDAAGSNLAESCRSLPVPSLTALNC